MIEADRGSKTATIVLAVLGLLGVACFALAGVAMLEQSTVTATSGPATTTMRTVAQYAAEKTK